MGLILLRASRRFACLLGAVHGLAMLAVTALPLGWPERALAVGVLAAAGVASVRRHALLRHRRAVVALVGRADGLWDLQSADGQWQEARLQRPCFVSAPLTVLRFRDIEARRTVAVIFMADSAHADDYRRLRVQLGGTPRTTAT